MAEIINLRQQRKARARADKEQHADDNRVRHGLSKAQKSQAAKQNALERKQLDGKTVRTNDD